MCEFIKKYALLLICAVGMLLRVCIPLFSFIMYNDPGIYYSDDSITYITPAIELLKKGTFTNNGVPELFRTPGYPIFLFAGILLNNIELVTIILQIFLSTLTIFLVYKLACLVFENNKITLAAALLYSLEPLSIIFCGLILTETLFTFIFTLFLYCFFNFLKKQSLSFCLFSAILLSLTTYIRPITIYLHLVLFIAGLIYFIFKKDKKAVLMFLIIAIVPSALNYIWIVHNKLVSEYSGFSSVPDVNLYIYQSAAVLAKNEQKSYYEMIEIQNQKASQYKRENNLTNAQTLDYMRNKGIEIMLSNPIDSVIIHLKDMAVAILTPGGIEFLKMLKLYPHRGGLIGKLVDKGPLRVFVDLFAQNPVLFWTQALLFVQLCAYYILFVGHFLSKRRISSYHIIFLLTMLCYFLFTSGGIDRFRHPFMPIICLLAGSGCGYFMERMSTISQKKIKAIT